MKTLKSLMILTIIYFVSIPALRGQESSPRIAILPLIGGGVDSVYVQTAESILRTEIGKLSTMDIISEKRTLEALEGTTCSESECALQVGKKLNASQVLGCRLSPLGEKIIAQYFVVDVSSHSRILVDETTAPKVEDLEMVMKRIAQSVVEHQPIGKGAEVGRIMESESTKPLRRASWRNFGLSFGYLYPQNGYDNADRIFVMDVRFDYTLDEYAVGMLLGARGGFTMNLYGAYLFSKKDLCPYIGGALGFHWVSHDNPQLITINYANNYANLKSDGFELTGNAGIRLMHTYDFELFFDVGYTITLNDYHDKAIIFTIGIL